MSFSSNQPASSHSNRQKRRCTLISSAAQSHASDQLVQASCFYSRKVVKVSELAKMMIMLPEIQRGLCEEHVQEIKQHQLQNLAKHGCYVFTGILTFCSCANTMYCIDGQHRKEAALRLYKENPSVDFDMEYHVIQCSDMSDVYEWFCKVNSNRPLPSFLQPNLRKYDAEDQEDQDAQDAQDATESSGSSGSMGSSGSTEGLDFERKLKLRQRQMREHLRDKFSDFLSNKEKCQQPNIHLDSFVEQVGKRYATQLVACSSAAKFVDTKNQEHMTYLMQHRKHFDVDKVLKRIQSKLDKKTTRPTKPQPFYLGAYWLKPVSNKVAKVLRDQVWESFYSKQLPEEKTTEGKVKCPCCRTNMISQGNHDCGHKQSFIRGGPTSADNLIPLCKQCNLSMGAMHFDDFARSLSGS